MRVWLLQTGEPLHSDGGAPRPMRAMNLADALVAQGHSVEVWSSAFYHQEKRHRSRRFESVRIHDRLVVHLIPSMGYVRNIGPARLIDHAQMALRLWRLLRSERFGKPDVAFVGYPPIEVAWVMLRWLRRLGVPSFIDVKDQWPSLFVDAMPDALKPVAKWVFAPYFWLGRQAMRNASAITSMSQPFLEWSLRFCGRARRFSDAVVPLVPARTLVTEAQMWEAKQWWADAGVDLGQGPCFSFVGSLSQAFDFTALKGAAEQLHRLHPTCRLVICGSGAEASSVQSLFAGLNHVVFPGWIDAPKIAALMAATVATLAPYRNTPDFQLSIPNKVLDSLAFGLPVVTALQGEVEELIAEGGVGLVCTDTPEGWLLALRRLLEDAEGRRDMSRRAAALYSERYDARSVYGSFVTRMEKLALDSHG
ncbi:MAG: glycosyltransferase family 4 protein [Rhodoferax sp.]|nr:glycosyltransferase family 4 protein [Rhodoferax sp.]